MTLELALHVQAELEQRAGEADAWRARQVQRAREEADIARLLIADVTMSRGKEIALGVRLRGRGLLDHDEMAERLGVIPKTVKQWRDRGRLRAHASNDKGECLYEWPDEPPRPQQRKGKAPAGSQLPAVLANRPREVQCEA